MPTRIKSRWLSAVLLLMAACSGRVTVEGDSLATQAKPYLEQAGFHVSATPGITLDTKLSALQGLDGTVVVELGTNDALQNRSTAEQDIDKAIYALRDNCSVFVAVGLLYDPNQAAAWFNGYLRSRTNHVYAWDQVLAQHPDWSYDTVHLKPEDIHFYAEGIVNAVHRFC